MSGWRRAVRRNMPVRQAGEDIAQMFSEMVDNMKARAADIRDVASRLVRILSGTETWN